MWEGDYFLILMVYGGTWILDLLIDSLLSNKQIERGEMRQIIGVIRSDYRLVATRIWELKS